MFSNAEMYYKEDTVQYVAEEVNDQRERKRQIHTVLCKFTRFKSEIYTQ